jgi:hypothetical protein
MSKFTSTLFYLIGITVFISISSCKKDTFLTDTNVKLNFSEDTLIFDTVFTSVGSATEVFLVYNSNNRPINISSIKIAGGANSNFRLNVDGVPGKVFNDVVIEANDSLFIFAEVTVDPNNGNTPLVITDSIVFETNGNIQDVDLVAWGQDAYFYRPTPGLGNIFFLNCNSVWNNDKPHVVYGYALIDSACTLVINAGAKVHFHPNSGMIVLTSGTLKVMGTATLPVTIQGDRLGQDYAEIPGQWNFIQFSNASATTNAISAGSKNSEINWAIIKNGNIGLVVDTVFQPNDTTLRLNNVIIKNMSGSALYARGSNIAANNCVFSNCGQAAVKLFFGGNYRFINSTIANYWTEGNRQEPALFLRNYFEVAGVRYFRSMNAQFYNSIITGNNDQEIGLDSINNGSNTFNYKFDHVLLKVENSFSTSDPNKFNAIIRGAVANPQFDDVSSNNYQLGNTSICIDAGNNSFLNFSQELLHDLNNNPRPQGSGCDLGAYEKR